MEQLFLQYKKAFLESWNNPEQKGHINNLLQKLVGYTLLSAIVILLIYKLMIRDAYDAYTLLQQQSNQMHTELYKTPNLIYQNDSLTAQLENTKQTIEAEILSVEEKYTQALPENYDISSLLTLLEDFTSSLSSPSAPLVLRDINFENQQKLEYISSDELTQKRKIAFPVETIQNLLGENTEVISTEFRTVFSIENNEVIFFPELNAAAFDVFGNQAQNIQSLYESRKNISIPAAYAAYGILATVEGTQEKLLQFIEFIQQSGNITQYTFRGKVIPLFSIQSFQYPLSPVFNSDGEEETQTIQFRLNTYTQLNAEEMKKAEENYKKSKEKEKNEQ